MTEKHPKSTSHISDPPTVFSRPSTKNPEKTRCTNSLSIVCGGFCPGVCQGVFCLEDFVRGGFCPFPLILSEYICYHRKLNITLNFMFHMYDKKFTSVTSYALYPPSVTNCHIFSDPFPSSVTHFMDGPYM